MLGRVFPLSFQAYLLVQVLGSILVNGAINYGFAWPLRDQAAIPTFGGWGSAAWDTWLSALLLSGLTVVFGSFFVRRDLATGKVRRAPDCLQNYPRIAVALRPTLKRALAFAGVFAPTGSAVALALLVQLPPALSFPDFLAFKLAFACLLGAFVTPLNVLWVVSEPEPVAAPSLRN